MWAQFKQDALRAHKLAGYLLFLQNLGPMQIANLTHRANRLEVDHFLSIITVFTLLTLQAYTTFHLSHCVCFCVLAGP